MIKLDKYTKQKKQEYFDLIMSNLDTLDNEHINKYINDLLSKSLADMFLNADDLAMIELKLKPKSYIEKLNNRIYEQVKSTIINRFSSVIRKTWIDLFELGVNHQVLDFIYESNIPRFKKGLVRDYKDEDINIELSRHGFDIKNFSIGEFAKDDNKSRKNSNRDLSGLNRNITNLRNNIGKLRQQGLYTPSNNEYVGRIDVEQRLSFLDTIKNISDFERKSEATKRYFLSSNYLRQRQRVLAEDYSSKYDTAIKEKVADSLRQNVEGIEQIRKRDKNIQTIQNQIKNLLEAADKNREGDRKGINPKARARMILRTESNLAYNFGKLSGLSGNEDLNKLVQWRVDFEIATDVPGYVNCEYCLSMNGKIYRVRDVLEIAMSTKDGVVGYQGTKQTKTAFLNPKKPQIPYHCNCIVVDSVVQMFSETSQLFYTKYIQDIKVGDYVYVPTRNKYQRVYKTHKNWHGKQIFKLRTSNGQELSLTGNHPVWTRKGWKDAEHIRVGEVVYVQSKQVKSIKTGDSREISKSKFSPSDIDRVKMLQQALHECDKAISGCKDKNGNAGYNTFNYCGKKKIVGKNEGKQSLKNARSERKDTKYYAFKGTSSASLSMYERERKVHSRVSRRPSAFFPKFLGSERSKNIEPSQIRMGVREANYTFQWVSLSARFLSTSMERIYRSQRLLDRRCKNKVSESIRRKPYIDTGIDREELLQRVNSQFQGLVPVRVTKIELTWIPQYVYNISVEGDECYLANGILTHNCSCQWQLIPSTEDNLKRVEKLDNAVLDKAVKVAAVGAIVGGAFLLSRSNVWTVFRESATLSNTLGVPLNLEMYEQATDAAGAAKRLGIIQLFSDFLRDIL